MRRGSTQLFKIIYSGDLNPYFKFNADVNMHIKLREIQCEFFSKI